MIDHLNALAFQMDRRIFLFAYYEPKPYREDESWYSRFCTATVNLYGLLKDCGPFLGTVLSHLSKTWRISDVCNDYYQLLDASVKRLTDGLERALNGLIHSSDAAKRNNTINFWIKQIASSYQKNPSYLLHTMAALYQWYLENGGSKPECHPGTSLRNQTIKWLRELYEEDPGRDWYNRWLPKEESSLESSDLYKLLWDWPAKWAKWNDCDEVECDEPPLPAGPFFRILAYDVDQYAGNPKGGYDPTVIFP